MDEVKNDNALNQLRQQIKKIMIPLLIKIFELKFAAQQSRNLPSRLQKQPVESKETVRDQLLSMEQNLRLLDLWCQSCQNQITKALKEIDSPDEPSFRPISSHLNSHPAVKKSFSEAVANQTPLFKDQSPLSLSPYKKFIKKFISLFSKKKV